MYKILLTLLIWVPAELSAQYALKFNALPLLNRHLNKPFDHDYSLDIHLNERHEISISYHTETLKSPETSIDEISLIFSYGSGPRRMRSSVLNLYGSRLLYKTFTSKAAVKNKIEGFNSGFFYGGYLDLMGGSRKYTESMDGVVYKTYTDPFGVSIGGGIALGYTVDWKGFIIEPQLGIGAAYMSQSLRHKKDDSAWMDFSRSANIFEALHPSYFSIHTGYRF